MLLTMDWPDGFWWGTGASSTQCEGASPASDWLRWEADGFAPPSGDGSGFGTRYAEDFALLAQLGLTHHRLGIDWARIEPEPGVRDPAAVEHYRAVLTAAHDAGVTPWVSLHHFTLPQWVADTGRFLNPETRTGPWARHVDFVAETFGDLVGGWQPINECNLYPYLAYRNRGTKVVPPGHNDPEETATALVEIHLANAEAAVRLRQTGAPVASILALAPVVLLDDDPASLAVRDNSHAALWDPGVHLFRDGVLRVRGRDPIERPDLAGAFDVIGFSYYLTNGVRAGAIELYPDEGPVSPLGYRIHADGVGLVLDRLHEELPDTPLLVAEFGVGTDDDEQRAAYLERGLEVVHDRIERGIDVRGFFHWTSVDNYEWIHGFDVRFGIIGADRAPKPSALLLAREAVAPQG